MTFDAWNDYARAHINPLPSPRIVEEAGDQVRYTWDLETMAELVPVQIDQMRRVGFDPPTGGSDLVTEVVGPRHLTVSYLTDPTLTRVDGSALPWRVFDERVARIWLIEDVPRAWYPVFMEQRREMISLLRLERRSLWTWLGMVRVEPLLATLAGIPSRADELMSMVFRPSDGADVMDALRDIGRELDLLVPAPVTLSTTVESADLLRLAVQAVAAAVKGVRAGSVNLMAYALERSFDCLFVIDRMLGAESHWAQREDEIWFLDSQEFCGSAEPDAITVRERTSSAISGLRSLCQDLVWSD